MSSTWKSVKDELLSALVQEIEAKSQKSGRAAKEFRPVGHAVSVPGLIGPVTCVLSVDLRGRPVSESALDGSFVATAAESPRFLVEEVVQNTGSELRVRVDAAVLDAGRVSLFVKSDPLQILSSLKQQLEQASSDIAGDVARGVLSPFLRSADCRKGLNAGQDRAVSECLTRGVNVVWGPPGTGKTEVIGRTIAEALATGRTVLLVSNTNVAVDGALLRGSERVGSQEPGVIVRVGEPALPEVADHPTLRLERACAALSRDARGRLENVERRIGEIAEGTERAIAEVNSLREIAARFDHATIEELRDRHSLAEEVAKLERRADKARRSLVAVKERAADARSETDLAKLRVDQCRPSVDARTGLTAISAQLTPLRKRLADAEAALDRASRKVAEVQSELESLGQVHVLRRRECRHRLEAARLRLSSASAAHDSAQKSLLNAEAEVEQERAELRSVASRATDHEFAEAKRHLATCREQLEALRDEQKRAEASLKDLRGRLSGMGEVSPLSPEEQALLRDADEADLDRVPHEMERLNALLAQLSKERSELMRSRDEILRGLADSQRDVVRQASVVATTLAKLAVDKHVAARRYDYVIVDEVSSALIPFVVYAATRADVGVALLGDFMQNGPISEAVVSRKGLPVSHWLADDYFTRIGIDSPKEALRRESEKQGVTTLVEQYRFVEGIAALANDVAYEGLLRTARTQPWSPSLPVKRPIVVLDVSDLRPELTQVRRERAPGKAGWWPAGAAASLCVARKLQEVGVSDLGIVTPYAQQAAVTLGALTREFGPGFSCGTAHRFQGREFDNVIFDLVEPLGHKGWMHAASVESDRWELAGVRLFNVAVTRARDTLYIVADMRVVRQAKPQTALGQLRAAVDEGRATVLPVSDFCHTALQTATHAEQEQPPCTQQQTTGYPPATTPAEQPRLLSPAVLAQPLFLTAPMVYSQLPQMLEDAKQQVQIWSPFIARRRLKTVLPALEAVVRRGVKVVVYTKPPEEIPDGHTNTHELLNCLRSAGVEVCPTRKLHEKVVLVDDDFGLYGSLNLLSHKDTSELMVRLNGHAQAEAFRKVMKVSA